jgi:hypothetical protein
MIEVLKQALTDAKRNERHNNVAETRYWLNQYKLIAEQAIKELKSQNHIEQHLEMVNQLSAAQRNELKQIEDGTWEADRNG